MSEGPDLSKLSDQELMALLQGGQQVRVVNKETGADLPHAQAQTYAQLAAAGGIDLTAPAGSARLPKAQTNPNDLPAVGDFYLDQQGKVHQSDGGVNLTGGLRAFARGLPVVGNWADEADAATAAAVAPVVEPAMRFLQRHGVPTGYDERMRLDKGKTFADRFRAAENLQQLSDLAYDTDHPNLSSGLQTAGTVGGVAATVLGAVPGMAVGAADVAMPVTSRLGAEAGLLPRMGAGAVEGGTAMGVQGYGNGYGDLNDAQRLQDAETGAALGAVGGGAAPVILKGAGAAYRATAGRVIDSLRGARAPVASAEERIAESLARPQSGETLPEGLRPPASQTPEQALAEILAARGRVPTPTVPASAEDDAYARIARAMDRQRQSPEEMTARVADLGPHGMLADTGDAMRNLARDAANRPSGAEDIIRQALETRQRGVFNPATGQYDVRPSSLRILNNAADNLGLGGRDFHSEFDRLSDEMKTAAEPLYDQVREFGPVDSPTLQKLVTRPSVQRAMKRAYRLAREDGVDPEGLGLARVEVPGPGNASPNEPAAVTLAKGPAKPPSQGPSLAKFIADGGGLRDQGGELANMDAKAWHRGKAFQKPLIGNGDSADGWALKAQEAGYLPSGARPTEDDLYKALAGELRGRPLYARAPDQLKLDRYNAANAAEEQAYRGANGEPPHPGDYTGGPAPQFEPAHEAQPTLQTWDYIKRGLDDELAPYREGKKAWDTEGRLMVRTLEEMRGELRGLAPVYGHALDAWSGPASMQDALNAGRKFIREDAPDLATKLQDLTRSERQMYRLGAVQALKDKLGGADVTYDAARQAGFLKPNQLERFKELFPTSAGFSDFMKSLSNEQAMFQTRGVALGNSTTAKQLLHAQDNDESPLTQAIHAGVAVKTGHVPAIVNILKTWGGPQKMSPATSEALASILTDTDRGALPAVAQRLTQAQKAQLVAEEIRKMTVGAGAQLAPSAVGERR